MAKAGIVLAAGKGTRMKSDLPKGLHQVCGVPMVALVIRALREAGVEKIVVVVGHGADQMRAALENYQVEFAVQEQQLGTGHAALMAAHHFEGFEGDIVVTPGDTPLLSSDAIASLLRDHAESAAQITVASFRCDDPTGYGRVVRGEHGNPVKIVEHKDANAEERAIREVNSSVYCVHAKTLFDILPTLNNQNEQKEYYLTDVLRIAAESGMKTHGIELPEELFVGVNDRWQLASAAALLRQRLLKEHALRGVTIIDPSTTYIGPDVELANDVVLEPMTLLEGDTKIEEGAIIGPNSRIIQSFVGRGTEVRQSVLNQARVGSQCRIGPFAHLRPGTVLADNVKIGNFVELKNATVHEGVSAGHLAYLGDAEVGAGANIGAGTITCNYDGFRKHRTEIGAGAFIGSNATLVAPLKIGDGAYVAAGSTITMEVSVDALALGRARQVDKQAWAQRWREKNEGSS